MNLFLLFFCSSVFYPFAYVAGYKIISPNHWNYLQACVVSKDTTSSMRQKINHILFQRHIPYVYGLTTRFRNEHYRKSKNIGKEDMLAYAYKGLYDSVKNYNGKYCFVNFARLHINGALYKSLTEHNQISVLSKNERRKKTTHINHNQIELRKNTYLQKRDYLPSLETTQPKHSIHSFHMIDVCKQKWDMIHTFPPFVKRCFYLRFDFYFNRIRSNKEVAELMCCKEEWVRRRIAKYVLQLTNNYTRISTE